MKDNHEQWKEAAQVFESNLAGLRKTAAGWQIELSVSSAELPASLIDTRLGTSFRIVSFELDQNARPVPAKKQPKGRVIHIAFNHEKSE